MKDVFKFEYIEEGRYQGVIDSYTVASTQDSSTTFLNLNIAIAYEDDEMILHKSYILDVGRNKRLLDFLKDCQLLKGKKADFSKLVGIEVAFDVEYDSENGKIRLSDLEVIDNEIQDDEEEE